MPETRFPDGAAFKSGSCRVGLDLPQISKERDSPTDQLLVDGLPSHKTPALTARGSLSYQFLI